MEKDEALISSLKRHERHSGVTTGPADPASGGTFWGDHLITYLGHWGTWGTHLGHLGHSFGALGALFLGTWGTWVTHQGHFKNLLRALGMISRDII